MKNDHSDSESTPADGATTFDAPEDLNPDLAEEATDQTSAYPEPNGPDTRYEIPVRLDAATRRALDRAFATVNKRHFVDAALRSPGVRNALASVSVTRLPIELPPSVSTNFKAVERSLTFSPGLKDLTPPLPTAITDLAVPPALGAVTADVQRRISGAIPPFPQLAMPSIEAMVPSIGLAQQKRITQAITSMESFAAYADRIPRLVVPAFDRLDGVQSMIQGLSNTVGKLLADWGSLSSLGHRLASIGLWAARDARAAVVAGDLDAVEAFARGWLGLKKITHAVIMAVSAALLDPGWDTERPDAVLPYIKSGTKREKKNHKLLGEIRAGRSKILPLDRQLQLGNGESTSFAEHLPGPDVQLRAAYENPLACAFLESFSEVEIEIVETYLQGGVTWPSAAIDCGKSGEFGEKVRRKFSYRKRKMTESTTEIRPRTA